MILLMYELLQLKLPKKYVYVVRASMRLSVASGMAHVTSEFKYLQKTCQVPQLPHWTNNSCFDSHLLRWALRSFES